MPKIKIPETREERAKSLGLTICPKCGYCNQKFNVNTYGTCTCCDFILDKKSKMRYEIKRRNNIKKRLINRYCKNTKIGI